MLDFLASLNPLETIASILVIISICASTKTRKGRLWMRGFNAIGSLTFCTWGIIEGYWALTILNVISVIIDVVYFVKTIKEGKCVQKLQKNIKK